MVLKHPFTALIAGSTRSGKTYLTTKLIKHAQEMIDPPPEETWGCMAYKQKALHEYQSQYGMKVVNGLPRMDQLEESW